MGRKGLGVKAPANCRLIGRWRIGSDRQLLMMWTALRPLPQDDLRVSRKESEMKQVMTIGLDIAKSVFLVHGVDAAGHMVSRQRLS
jgi:hypothetical protein